MYLSQLDDVCSNIASQYNAGSCIHNHSGTSLLLWNQWPPKWGTVKNNPRGWTHWWVQHIDGKCEHGVSGLTDLGKPAGENWLFIHWSNTWETADFTLIRKWKWRLMNGFVCYSCQLPSNGIWNSCQEMTNALILFRIMLKNNDTLVEQRGCI
jgi:hypothetical protein